MSKIKNNKINFDEDDFVVQLCPEPVKEQINVQIKEEISQAELEKNRIEQIKQDIILSAQKEKEDLIKSANEEKERIIKEAQKQAQEIINNATLAANEQEESSKKQAQELLENSQQELEQIRIKATHDGYQDGYQDGQGKIVEELEEKIEDFNKLCLKHAEIRQKVLKAASKDILNIISSISRKILLKEVDEETLLKVIQTAISTLEKKENINVILSKKYAQMLFELQKKNLSDDIELNFEEFKQYENFNIIYNQELEDDTIIIENLKERLDASISTQLDVIIRNIYEKNSDGQIELEEYIEEIDTDDKTEQN